MVANVACQSCTHARNALFAGIVGGDGESIEDTVAAYPHVEHAQGQHGGYQGIHAPMRRLGDHVQRPAVRSRQAAALRRTPHHAGGEHRQQRQA